MEKIIEINLPTTKYRLLTEALLFKISVPDFAKLLKIIGQQALPYETPAGEYYRRIRQLIDEAEKEFGPQYIYPKPYEAPGGAVYYKDAKVNVHQRLEQLRKKLDAAEKKYTE